MIGSDGTEASTSSVFSVRLSNFEGPFDLLLTLIGQQKLDVTHVALHQVTDDFIAHTKRLGEEYGLDQTTEFLVVAATLLDLKAARLLPAADVDDEEDLALLEAQDVLFARLLEYRAYRQIAELFSELEQNAQARFPRSVSLEDRFVDLLPEVTLGITAEKFAELAAAAFRPRPSPEVSIKHMHGEDITVPEEAQTLLQTFRDNSHGRWFTFTELVADCDSVLRLVVRFLSLLELFRDKAIDIDQDEPLGVLRVRWTGTEQDRNEPGNLNG
ncbi:segregation/condensation protein A [Hoyosella rhizosphaerae]|uniref:Segregation and condensation protein A n=1 Tax=Hoyosella rhizosphaerae TaxID=1755582 RepID=A0A916U6Y0_9ACTN|nr:segregation/condensation protein A [Hoyosella rhizosphaerae]MBN4926191.1 segregation/condensation protein A [Hoyosella rhizosphaerae]GGC61403.1 segregation/condensation protein A [Hoyosella rhizosphaerae]